MSTGYLSIAIRFVRTVHSPCRRAHTLNAHIALVSFDEFPQQPGPEVETKVEIKRTLRMPKVIVLADHIASQIAAGEVVERPASVVKELVENSIDSGATRIEISLSADMRTIRIADDGCGMEPEDAVLAFHRHATSKLRSVDDLWKLQSLGFRGEALPSIASVAKVTCYTRTSESQTGYKIEARDGHVTTSETGCAPGTVMEIADLFYNVPARLSFLKKASTEFGHVQEIVQALAISYLDVAFHLINDGETTFKTAGQGDLALADPRHSFVFRQRRALRGARQRRRYGSKRTGGKTASFQRRPQGHSFDSQQSPGALPAHL